MLCDLVVISIDKDLEEVEEPQCYSTLYYTMLHTCTNVFFSLQGSCLKDLLCAWCCGLCAIVQEAQVCVLFFLIFF